jgi:bacterioferritin-associated ferredoxin
MLVCHCERVFERSIRECVRAGARTVDEVSARCGAGAGCGGCHEVIEAIVEREASPQVELCTLRLPVRVAA